LRAFALSTLRLRLRLGMQLRMRLSLFTRLHKLRLQRPVGHALQGAEVGARQRRSFKGAQQRSAVAARFIVGNLLGRERG